MNKRKIHFEIGELVLDGFSYHDHLRIKKAIEQELIQLVSEKCLDYNTDGNRNHAAIDGGDFHFTHSSSPKSIGVKIAQAMHNALIKSYRIGDL